MVHDPVNGRLKARRAVLALALVTVPLGCLDSPGVHAQSIMRSPNLNIGSRAPSINMAPRIDPNIAGRAVIGIGRITPNLKTYQDCYARRMQRQAGRLVRWRHRRRVGQDRQQRRRAAIPR